MKQYSMTLITNLCNKLLLYEAIFNKFLWVEHVATSYSLPVKINVLAKCDS